MRLRSLLVLCCLAVLLASPARAQQAESSATDRYGIVPTRLAYDARPAGTRATVSAELRNAFDR